MNKITFLVDLNYCLKCLDAARLSQPIDNKVPKVRKPNKITYLYTMIIYSPMSVPSCYLFYYLKIN